MKTILACLITALLFSTSCSNKEDTRTNPSALASRQLVVENFGKEVYALNSEGTDFIARCPDGSVWRVVVYWSWNNKKLEVTARTQIFPENLQPFPEEP